MKKKFILPHYSFRHFNFFKFSILNCLSNFMIKKSVKVRNPQSQLNLWPLSWLIFQVTINCFYYKTSVVNPVSTIIAYLCHFVHNDILIKFFVRQVASEQKGADKNIFSFICLSFRFLMNNAHTNYIKWQYTLANNSSFVS